MSYDPCKYCGSLAYKTNGNAELICYNRAMYGTCESPKPVVKEKSEKIGRNAQCPCGSGKKFKNCCLESINEKVRKSIQ